MSSPKLYHELADWWPLLSSPSEYEEEATFFERLLIESCDGPCRQVLELGSGGGNNASFMKKRFTMVLADRSPGMLAVSRTLNPECEHVEGDMRTLRLPRQFDAVFVHDAVTYMTTEHDLRQAIETAYVHCRPGGAVLFAPDHVRETFHPSTDHGGHDGSDRALRYLEWTWDPDPDDATYTVDYAYVLRDRTGSARVEIDRHIEGLFSLDQWQCWLREAGFIARAVPFDHSEIEPGSYQVFTGYRLP